MINREIFTESPEDDLWRELLQYSYRANVSRYLKEHSLDEDEDTINTIIGSFLQANEYFKASKSANLQISPLLLYYGATNLLLGLTSLMTGKRPEIKNHGMTAIDSTISTYIAEANVVFGDPNTGGIHQFARILGFEKDLTKCGEWKMMDFLSSIVEIDQNYRKCYAQENGNTLLLDLFNTPTGTIERLYLNKNKVEAISAVLNNVEGFEKNYLLPQVGHERESDRDYLILRKKMSGKDIKRISFSGQPYLQAGFIKNGQLIALPPLFNMYAALFIMGSLCRYHPEKWGPFVLNDETGERLLFEKFLYLSRRIIPNSLCVDLFANAHVYSTHLWVNALIMLLGVMLFAVGTGFYAAASLGRGSYEALTFSLAEKNGWQIKVVRMILDIVMVIAGVLLGGKFGICTIVTIIISGPVIQFTASKTKKLFKI